MFCLLIIFPMLSSLIPEKMMREWKELVLNGLPLYEQPKGLSPTYELYTPLDTIECRRLEVLNNQNFDEYMVGRENAC